MYTLLLFAGKIRNDAIQRDLDGAIIPISDDNMDYVAYKTWLAEGNTPNQPVQSKT